MGAGASRQSESETEAAAWRAVFVPGELRFAWPASWTWTDEVEVALESFTIDSRCPDGPPGSSCLVDVFTLLIILLLVIAVCTLPCCIVAACRRRKRVPHVHETMPTALQAWVLGSEALRAHPQVEDALREQAQRAEEAERQRLNDSKHPPPPGTRRHNRHYTGAPVSRPVPAAPAAPSAAFESQRKSWHVQLLGHVPAGEDEAVGKGDLPVSAAPHALDESLLRRFLAAATAPALPASDSSLCPSDPRERRRCACAPGGDAAEFLLALGALQREAEALSVAALSRPEEAEAEAAAAAAARAPPPANAPEAARLRHRALLARTEGALSGPRMRRLLEAHIAEASVRRFALATDARAVAWLQASLAAAADSAAGAGDGGGGGAGGGRSGGDADGLGHRPVRTSLAVAAPLDLRHPPADAETRVALRRLLRRPQAHGCATMRALLSEPARYAALRARRVAVVLLPRRCAALRPLLSRHFRLVAPGGSVGARADCVPLFLKLRRRRRGRRRRERARAP